MKNFGNSLKRFIKNKNTITILGVLVIVGLLYFGYTYQINTQVKPVRVAVAATTIQPRTLIKDDMVTYIEVPQSAITSNVIRSSAAVVGQYSNYNTIIPAGSMFYKETVISADDLPDSAFVDVKEGQRPYQFPVSMESTYGNSIFPGNRIDIYMKAVDDQGQVMVGKLLENVEVLGVKDSSGKNVFENTSEDRIPSMFIFGVNSEINILLRKASYMTEYSVVLFPVPHGGNADIAVGETQVSTIYLKDFINSHTVVIDENSGEEDKGTEEDKNKDNQKEGE